MNPHDFKSSPSGRLVPIPGAHAFIPNPLPPALDMRQLIGPLEKATLALGELSGVGGTIPNPHLLIEPFSRKEAVASSKIEGTVTTLHELLNFEVGADPSTVRSDTREVRNYKLALDHGLKRVHTLPVSKRLIQEMHEILLGDVTPERGAHFIPGEFKRDQNRIGGRLLQNARFVPPPPTEAIDCLDALEKYIHTDDGTPLLIKLALVHYQFETIHPFPDGNGRVGRLLVPLILCEQKALSQPLLYLSDFFEKNFTKYIELMFDVSKSGAWGDWITFFLNGVCESARDGIRKARALQTLQKAYLEKVQTARSSALLAKLVNDLFLIPAVNIRSAMSTLDVSFNSAKNNIRKLEELGILERGPERRPQWFYARKIIAIGFEDAGQA
jgi:Fic family protein